MITADYRLHFRELSVHAEPGASLLTRSVATGLDALVRGNGGVLDLHGTMQIDASTCSGSLSLDAQLVGRLLFDATLEQLGLSPAEKLAIKALLPQAREWGRALLDRWRTSKP